MVVSLAIEARLSKLRDYVRNRKVILDPRPTDLYVVMSTNLGTAPIVVQLPEDHRKLLLTGRPWQFLEPGPDENDLDVELMSIESTVAELSDVSER
ncbi:hypothetical protein KXX35_002868, partial [Aspergillus fumigatus]